MVFCGVWVADLTSKSCCCSSMAFFSAASSDRSSDHGDGFMGGYLIFKIVLIVSDMLKYWMLSTLVGGSDGRQCNRMSNLYLPSAVELCGLCFGVVSLFLLILFDG